jgi:hypothetical protein
MSISKEIKKVNRKFKSWLFKREYQKNNFSESKKLILFYLFEKKTI